MPFGSLSAAQQIMVRLRLLGGPQYRAGMEAASRQTKLFAASTTAAGTAMAGATRKSFLMNQATFTLRRGLFYTTLAVAGLAFGAAKLGFEFYNTMQTASVAFKGFLGSARAVNIEMNKLYLLAAATPFSFPDIVKATRRMLPFVGNLRLTNQLVHNLTDALSAAGMLTGSALDRASIALSHMFTVGRLTGQGLFQLGRDWVPMQKALEHYFHADGAAIKKMVSEGLVSATVAAAALNREMQLKGFKGAGIQQATKTLSGAWSTFKDLIGMAAGTSMTGPLNGLTVLLGKVDKALIGQVSASKPLTIERLVKAIDTAVSPRTHIILNLFSALSDTLWVIVNAFGTLFFAISQMLRPLDYLGGLLGSSNFAARLFGHALGVLITLFLIWKIRLMVATLWLDAYEGSLFLAGLAQGFFNVVVVGGSWALLRFILTLISAEFWIGVFNGLIALGTGLFVGLTSVLYTATTAMFGFAAAEGAASIAGAILLGVIALGVGLVILYYRWKRFHDLVNSTWAWIKRNSTTIAIALTVAFGPLVGIAALTLEIALHFERIKRAVESIPKWLMHPVAAAQQTVRTARSVSGTGGGGSGWGGGIGSAVAGAGRAIGNFAAGGLTGVPGTGIALGMLGFQHGGTVPGPMGAPQMIMAHGGETVIPIGQNLANANDRPIVVQLVVDRKVLAEQVARANQDHAARR
jgi:tape measure domain-containing protein